MSIPSVHCSTCAYSDDGYSPARRADGDWLLCRRRAPVVYADAGDGYRGGDGIFPRVARDDWCGEWVQCCINTSQPKQRDYLTAELGLFHESRQRDVTCVVREPPVMRGSVIRGEPK